MVIARIESKNVHSSIPGQRGWLRVLLLDYFVWFWKLCQNLFVHILQLDDTITVGFVYIVFRNNLHYL
jgi:hypothetical protein